MATKKRKASSDEEGTDQPPSAQTASRRNGEAKTKGKAPAPGERRPGVSFGMNESYYRRLYNTEPDFRQLSRLDPAFASVAKPNGQLDFTDPVAVKQLTTTLLKLDFGLEIELPDDRLCPPVPNRHNYIMWLKDLLDSSTPYEAPENAAGRASAAGRRVVGLDIGTGASCIYPLLGCAQRPGWHFFATDVDEKSLECARRNVLRNRLQDRIRILPRRRPDAGSPLIPLDELGVDSIDFVMTNPPFYESEAEMAASARKKARPPHSACTGAPVEMVCDGGEVAFVGRIVAESRALRGRVRWYTAMLGKLSSVEEIVDRLLGSGSGEDEGGGLGIDNYAVTEFVQGGKTRRWAVAWSFGPMRPAQHVARGMKALAWKKILPPVVEVCIDARPTAGDGIGALAGKIDGAMHSLELMSWVWDTEALRGVGRARENVWGRAWRRKKLREGKDGSGQHGDEAAKNESETCAFGFVITIAVGCAETTTTCRWTEGHDEPIFQSFCGFLKAQLKDI